MTILFANNARSTLATALAAGATSATLAPGGGGPFPAPTGSNYFVADITDAATRTLHEIVHVTSRVGDTVTLVRAQEGTPAQSWAAGAIFANQWTAGQAAAMVQT